MTIKNPFGSHYADLTLPEHTHIVSMGATEALSNPKAAIREALEHPIASDAFKAIAQKHYKGPDSTATIVISDNTRPVPYTGEQGILWPLIEVLLALGYQAANITVLIGTGTHRAVTQQEIAQMLDPLVLASGVKIVNHDCRDLEVLVRLGTTKRGTEILLNKMYVEADLKIATGLVETHFMAGVSGGRKAICPGIIGEMGTYVFHSVPLMADPNSRDLHLENNPVHEESLEVALKAGVDFLLNVTLDHQFRVTGVFAGDLIKAHEAAVAHVKKSVHVPSEQADIVITHAGFVGINHYQCAKAAVGSLGILKEGGHLILLAHTSDSDNKVGSLNYRTVLSLLKLIGKDAFMQLIKSKDWTFIPDQWQVQMWAKVFERIDQDNMVFYCPNMEEYLWPLLPGLDGRPLATAGPTCYATVVTKALAAIAQQEGKALDELSIVWIEDGPYVIPYAVEDKNQ